MIQFKKKVRDFVGYDPKKRSKPIMHMVERTGRIFQMDNEDIELFPVGVLAEALDRSSHTLKLLELKGEFPKPMFRVTGSRTKRWYSSVQILNLHRLMYLRHGGRKYFQDRELYELWLSDVKELFYKRTVVIDEHGNKVTEG